MKKTLHAEDSVFASMSNGQIKIWNQKDAEALVEAANNHLANKSFNPRVSITQEEFFCMSTYELLARLTDEGLTEKFLNEVNSDIAHVRYQHLLMPSNYGSPHWQCVADMNNPDPGLLSTFMFTNVLALGGFDNLKRCKMDGCKKFFIGRPNKDWCSKSCGSKHRVRKKRKRHLE